MCESTWSAELRRCAGAFAGLCALVLGLAGAMGPARAMPGDDAMPDEHAAAAPEAPAPPADFALYDARGHLRRLAEFRGKVVVVFFGYAYCPEVCPLTLQDLAQVMRELGPESRRVQVVFITVDPERDTRKVVDAYATVFDKRFLGLRGSASATAKAAKSFDASYARVPGARPGQYGVDHTAASFIVDPEGRLRVVVGFGQPPAVYVRDIRRMLAAYPATAVDKRTRSQPAT